MHFFPKSLQFFERIDEISHIVQVSGKLLREISVGQKNTPVIASRMRKLEKKADEICHTLFREADNTLVTPIDREDIHRLARSLDNIVDLIENTVSIILSYRIKKPLQQYSKFTFLTRKSTQHLLLLVQMMKYRGKRLTDMRREILTIHSLENEGDQLLGEALSHLFTNGKSTLTILKWKDVFENMEDILDECEETADIVEEIIIKNF